MSGRGGADGCALAAEREPWQWRRLVGPAAAASCAPRQLTAVFSPQCKQVPPGRRQRRRGEPEGSSAMGPLRESKVRKARSVDAGGSVRERWREREGNHCRARRARCELEGWRLEWGKRGQEGGGEDGKRGTFAQVMRAGRWVGA